MNVVLDTNILIDSPSIVTILTKEHKVIIPYVVLKELDKLKRDHSIGFMVRNAIRTLLSKKDELIFDNENIDNPQLTNDEKIILIAKKNDAILYTNDIHMTLLADSYGVECKHPQVFDERKYEPYLYISEEEIAEEGFTFQNSYSLKKINSLLDKLKISADTWKFIIIENNEGEITYIYAYNPIKQVLERIDNNSKYKTIKNSLFTIKALDEYQIIAIYALKEAPNVLLTGKWGSGKNILSVSYALDIQPNKKIFISRPNIGINSKFDIGYLPGDKNDKLIEWSAGFLSALYYIYGNTKGQKQGSVSYDYVKETVFPEKFEIIPLNMIQGLSLLEDDIMIVDEIQLISVDYMSMLLSRFSKGSKLIMLGDYKQTYDVVKSGESGLLQLIKSLPHKELCWVKLKKTHRSGLTELADDIKERLDI